MESIARGLGLPLPSLRLGFAFGFGATLAGGRARSLELEEATSCDACAFTRLDASSLAHLERSIWRQIDLAQAAQRIKVWGQRESNRQSLGSATRFTIRDEGRLKTPNINKRPGTCIVDTRVLFTYLKMRQSQRYDLEVSVAQACLVKIPFFPGEHFARASKA